MKRISITATLLIVSTALIIAGAPAKIENFTLNDYTGKKISLTDYKDSKAIILMFIATECPVSNAYNERYNQLYNDYKGKKVAIVGINSNKAESVDDIKSHAKEHGFEFAILKDVNNIIADKLDAQRTPEVYIVNPSTWEVVYHGRIDDSQRESNIKSKDLRAALDEVLAGKPVSVKDTKAFGCTIKRVQ
ncbi:MAG: thioredoxin family protein [Ignavibacteriales bacterium]|nr:thioredoxin family protein [Ignavibacteriales bacterium]